MAALCSCTCSINFGNPGNKHVKCKGEVITKNLSDVLEPDGFDQIVINGSADLKYAQGEEYGIEVEANEEVFQYLNYHVEDGVLFLETIDNVQIQAKKYDIYLESPILKRVVANGASDASIVAVDSQEKLEIQVNGAGDIELQNITVPELTFTLNGASDLDASELNVGSLNVSINGAGDVCLSGKAEKASLSVSGAGDIDARNLECASIGKNKAGVARIRTQQ